MTVINAQITPINGRSGSPHVNLTDDGTRYTPVTITIPTGQTYATADQVALVHNAGQDFYSQYGGRTIKNIIAEDFACNGVSFGAFKLDWNYDTQRALLRRLGNGGSVAPTGPQDDTELPNGTALGAGLMTANAVIFW